MARSLHRPLISVLVVVFAGLGQGFSEASTNRFNVMGSPVFTQAFVHSDCLSMEPCLDDDFNLAGESYADCFTAGHSYEPCYSYAYGQTNWWIDGDAGFFPRYGDTNYGSRSFVRGNRVSEDVFSITGSIELATQGLTGEVAVFRFSGNPAIFDGVEADSVTDLVNMGLISGSDVLAVETTTDYVQLQFDVAVTGIPDDEIVVFAAAQGPVPVPEPAFSGLVSESYSYCYATSRTEVWGNSYWGPEVTVCENSELANPGNCSIECYTPAAASTIAGSTAWGVDGWANWGTDAGILAGSIEAQGTLASADTFVISGTQSASSPWIQPEIAVFRYSGDPSEFEDLEPYSIAQLLKLGLIDESDVLFVHQFDVGPPSDFSFDVDVSGVPSNEIVVFASGRAKAGAYLDIPATSATGTILLVVALLGVGGWALMRQRPRSASR